MLDLFTVGIRAMGRLNRHENLSGLGWQWDPDSHGDAQVGLPQNPRVLGKISSMSHQFLAKTLD
jgi:hypothetical protein